VGAGGITFTWTRPGVVSGFELPFSAPVALALDGETLHESAWTKSGAGPSRYFARPSWQAAVSPASKGRAVADVALNAEQHYWMIYLGEWEQHGGTSFAAPVFAALVAVIDGHRRQSGRPPVGFLNPILYSDAAVQASFRDVVEGATGSFAASVGWDHASGWGAPRGTALADSIP
jgi:kumamolisin